MAAGTRGFSTETPLARGGVGELMVQPQWLGHLDGEIEELMRAESVGLVVGERREGMEVLHELGRVFKIVPESVTEAALPHMPFRHWGELVERLAGCSLLFDLESLCWDRGFGLDVLRFLRMHARDHGVVALWPGWITERHAVFSAPCRRDFVRFALSDLSVLRPVGARFSDEVPFEIERFP